MGGCDLQLGGEVPGDVVVAPEAKQVLLTVGGRPVVGEDVESGLGGLASLARPGSDLHFEFPKEEG